jgi:hypothetical protein
MAGVEYDGSGRGLGDVLADLDEVIARARSAHSSIGIFPAMYRSVTAEIHEGVQSGSCEDCPRMEHLAVVFADRYLDALRMWERGSSPPQAWGVAFQAASDGRRRTIAQHLLAGMNAHINLDLGIAVAGMPAVRLEDLEGDFLRVNEILFSRVDRLQEILGRVSRRMALVDRIGISLDERIMQMAIGNAREHAWDLAVDLSTRPSEVDRIIAERDRETTALGTAILGGNAVVRWLARVVARAEPADVTRVLDAFAPE